MRTLEMGSAHFASMRKRACIDAALSIQLKRARRSGYEIQNAFHSTFSFPRTITAREGAAV